MTPVPKTLLAFGFHDLASPRHYTLQRHFEAQGYTIVECHTAVRGFLGKCLDLTKQYRRHKKKVDTVLVTFPGHHLVWLAWVLSRISRKRLIFDAFISAYDTLVVDRKKFSKWHPFAWVSWLTDYIDCHLADEVLIDTEAHKKYFCGMFHVRPSKMTVVYLEAPPIFKPTPNAQQPVLSLSKGPTPNAVFHVLFYGSYIPLQGIDVILNAAAELQGNHADIHFTFIGGGQTYNAMRALADQLRLSNVTFEPAMPMHALPEKIQKAHVTLGIFGTGGKTQRVIPHKVIEALACDATVITADTPAMHERYGSSENLFLVPAGNSSALAQKIWELRQKAIH